MSRVYVEGDFRLLLEDGGLTYHKIYLEEGTTLDEAKNWIIVLAEGGVVNHLWPLRLEQFNGTEWVLI